jgi:Tol biopolymer transport system component
MNALQSVTHSLFRIERSILLLPMICVSFLAGCGGGGGGGGGTPAKPPSPPPPPARTAETIVFVASDGSPSNGASELYAISDDGTNRIELSAGEPNSDAAIGNFEISPDGQWVAFLTDPDASGVRNFPVLFVVPIDGSSPPILVSQDSGSTNRTVKSFDWSPDSTRLAYDGNFDQSLSGAFFANEVWVVNRDGSGRSKINGSIGFPVAVEVREPEWSSSGRWVLQRVYRWTSSGPSGYAIGLNVYDSTQSGANSTRLLTALSRLDNVALSPVDDYVSVTADATVLGRLDVTRIRMANNAQSTISIFGDIFSLSKFSPDGADIAYHDHPNTNMSRDLYVAPVRGIAGHAIETTGDNALEVLNFDWSPDGSTIAYLGDVDTDGLDELFVAPADGAGPRTRLSGTLPSAADVLDFAWSPDGTRVAYVSDKLTDTFRDLFVVDSDGTNEILLSINTDGEEVVDFAWSADGERIAFTTGPDIRTPIAETLYVIELDGDGRIELTQPLTGGPVTASYR